MKRDLHIKLLREFILEKPGRSYNQVEQFGREIDATTDEIHAAIDEIEEKVITDAPSHPRASYKESAFSKVTHAASVALVFFVLLILLYTNFHAQKTLQPSSPKSYPFVAPLSSETSLAPPVFANQARIDPHAIFSYTPSDVHLSFTGTPKKEVLGFFPYWMLDVSDKINLFGYTSISIFGLEVDSRGTIVTSQGGTIDEGWSMWNDERLDTFIQRAKKKRIKVFLTLKSFSNDNIERIVLSDKAQKQFIANAITLVNSKAIAGININFEYVGTAPTPVVSGFTRLIGNLNAELKRQIPDAQLTVDTYIRSGAEFEFFDLPLLAEHVDSFVIMGYDIHTPGGSPGPVSPLEGAGGLVGYMESYLNRVGSEKLILALPYYGYSWPVSPSQGVPVSSTGQASASNAEVKTLPYAEIMANNTSSTILWNETAQTPYVRYVDTLTHLPYEAHFENTRSLGLKYDFVNSKNLKGVGIWAMGYDGLNQELTQLVLDKFAK